MKKIGDDPTNAAAHPDPSYRWYLQTRSLLRPGYLNPALTRQSKDIELEKLLYYNIYKYLLLMSSVNGRRQGTINALPARMRRSRRIENGS